MLSYVVVAGFLFPVPELPIVNETIRNQYFHVPMWFGMMILFLISLIQSIKYLRYNDLKYDLVAVETVNVGVLYGILGCVTGAWWAKYSWGDWWSGDPKQDGAAICMLIYFAYIVLRNSIPDPHKRAKISSIYNIFAFSAMIPLLFIIPRILDSLHPGSGGNPGFKPADIDAWMRVVFYPAVIGFTLWGLWMASIRIRMRAIKMRDNLHF